MQKACVTCEPGPNAVALQIKERPLHIAARHGHAKMVEALLDDEASPLLKSRVSIVVLTLCFRN